MKKSEQLSSSSLQMEQFNSETLEINDQSPSSLLATFLVCDSCRFIVKFDFQMGSGYKCSRCGFHGDAIGIYFPSTVSSLIDLMQEFYHLKQGVTPNPLALTKQTEGNHQLAVVIFFCSLVEVLLQHFLNECMLKVKLPYNIRKRLFDDTQSVKQRIQKLFPPLTGVKWKDAVKTLSKRGELNYHETVEFFKRVSDVRNKLLHEGTDWVVPDDMPKQCIYHIWPLICLFVALHNEYVALPVGEGHLSESNKK